MGQFNSESAKAAGAKSRGGGWPRNPKTGWETVLAHLKKRLDGTDLEKLAQREPELTKLGLVELGRLAKMLRGLETAAAAKDGEESQGGGQVDPGETETEEEEGDERERAALRVLDERNGESE